MATRIAIGLLLALAASFPALASKPEVVVEFEITVTEFTENLPEFDQAVQTVRKALATELQRQVIFANWLTAAPADPQMQLGRLVARLEQDTSTGPGPRVFVRFWGARPNGPLKELGLPEMEIYSASNLNWDTNNRRDFETRIVSRTMEKIRNDGFRDKLVAQFLGKLPLSSAVEPKSTERVIEIPVRWSEMLLSSETVLLVQIKKSVPDGNREGDFKLVRIVARVDQNAANPPSAFPARLRGSLQEVRFDGQPIDLGQQAWNDEVLRLLANASVNCFILTYKPKDELEGDSDRLEL